MFKKMCFLKGKKAQYIEDLITIKKEFTRHDPKVHVLNLDNINLSQQENLILNDIIKLIKSDEKTFYLSENRFIDELLNKNLEQKYQIKQLLIDKKFKYETFASDFIHCLIANHVYCYTYDPKTSYNINDDIISGYSPIFKDFNFALLNINTRVLNDNNHSDYVWRTLSEAGWVIHSIYRTSGYKSIIYINESKKQIIVGYQGMKFKFKDLFTKDYKSYIEALEKHLIKKHLKLVIQNVTKCVELSDKLNYSLSFTGYSFGAILAQLSLFICHKYLLKIKQVKSVVFESIGVYELLNKLNSETNRNNIINLNDLDARVYLIRPSFFNTTNTHLGTMCDIFVTNQGRQIFDKANKVILDMLQSEFETFSEFNIEECSIHKYYINGLKSLQSINIKYFFYKFILFSSYSINVYTKWTCNFKLDISESDYKVSRKKNNSAILSSKFFRQALLRTFKSTELIKDYTVLETKIEFIRKSFLNPETKIIEKKPFIKDYSDHISYDAIYDLKVLNLDNEIHNYLYKIYKLYKIFRYKSLEIENCSTYSSNRFDENLLIQKQLINLCNHFQVTYEPNNIKSIVTNKEIPIVKIFETFLHISDLNPNLKTKIDSDYLELNQSLQNIEIILNKDFCNKTDSFLNDFIDLKHEYDLSYPFTFIIGEYGTGKTTLAIKLAKDLISNHDNTLLKFIDCSSIHSIFLGLNEIAGMSLINHDQELTFYDNIKCLIPILLEMNINRLILILDDLKESSFLNDFVDLEKEFSNRNLNLHLIIPIDPTKKSFIPQFEGYNLIKLSNLDNIECCLMLQDFELYTEHIFNDDYNMDDFINELLVTENSNKIPMYKIKSLKTILKRNITKKLDKNEILKCKENLFDFIRCDNKSVYNFLFYIIHLNRNNLNLLLLKHVYKLINNYDELIDKSFEVNFNSDLEYLLNMSILTESHDGNYRISALFQHEFETRIVINNEFKLRVILVDLLALNQFAEHDRKMPNRYNLYYLHLENLLNRYALIFNELEEKVRNNLKPLIGLRNFFKKTDDIDNPRKKSSSLDLEQVDHLVKGYRESFKNKLNEFKNSFHNISKESREFLTSGIEIINKNADEAKNRLQLDFDTKLLNLESYYEIDSNLMDFELEPSFQYEFISKKNRLKNSFDHLLAEIQSYKKACVSSYKNNKNKRELLLASLNAALDYLKYFFKEIDSNDFYCDEKFTFDYNKALKELINLENEFFSSIRLYSRDILFPIGSIQYEKSDLNELGIIFFNPTIINQ